MQLVINVKLHRTDTKPAANTVHAQWRGSVYGKSIIFQNTFLQRGQ
jgi:hypothetical protein